MPFEIVAFCFLRVNGNQLGRSPGADVLDLIPADNVHPDLDLRIQWLQLKR